MKGYIKSRREILGKIETSKHGVPVEAIRRASRGRKYDPFEAEKCVGAWLFFVGFALAGILTCVWLLLKGVQ